MSQPQTFTFFGGLILSRGMDSFSSAFTSALTSLGWIQSTENVFTGSSCFRPRSDWFWWYGDDKARPGDAVFDQLFRKHLQNVYLLSQVFESPGVGVRDPLVEGPHAVKPELHAGLAQFGD